MIGRLKTLFLDLLFPADCVVCGRAGDLFCVNCQSRIKPIAAEVCLLCNRIGAQQGICADCGLQTSLDQIAALGQYGGTVLETVIHELKFNYLEQLAKPLANLLLNQVQTQSRWLNISRPLIVPVPLHKKRLLERGFNQSQLLAQFLAAGLNWPVEVNVLRRIKYTSQQARLNREARLENVKDAFIGDARIDLSGRTIILIDDVLTTGATLNQAALALKTAGAKQVRALVLAHDIS